jgi:hypothetical protein
MTLRARPLRREKNYEEWEPEGDLLVSGRQAILKPLNGGRFEQGYIYTNPKRVGKILELLVQIEAILTELRSHIPDKPMWLYTGGFIRILPEIRGHEHLFRLGEKRLEELNTLLSTYRWSPQIQILRGFLFQMRPRQTQKTTLSQRREYWIVESLLREAERGNLYRYKNCPECKKWFYALTDHQRFCGNSCRKRYASHSGEYKLKRREYMKTYRRKQKSLDRSALVSARRG